MARDPDTIEREIEQARDALAGTIDQLSERANPKRLVESGKTAARRTLENPKVRIAIGVAGAVVVLVVGRLIFGGRGKK